MTSTRMKSRTAGYSLMELMLVLTLLTIFAGIANKLFVGSFFIKSDALHASQSIAQNDATISRLRTDVWGASAIRSDAPDQATIQMHDGSGVQWKLHVTTIDDETQTHLIRTEIRDGVETPGDPLWAPPDIGFGADGPDLLLTTKTDTIRLTSVRYLIGVNGVTGGGRP